MIYPLNFVDMAPDPTDPSPTEWAMMQRCATDDQRTVLLLLAHFASQWDMLHCAPDLETLVLLSKLPRARVRKALKSLQDAGLAVPDGRMYGLTVRRLGVCPLSSADLYAWAWRQSCPTHPARVVLIALAWEARALGGRVCAPSIEGLARRTELTAGQVGDALTCLERAGLIACEIIGDAVRYRLLVPHCTSV